MEVVPVLLSCLAGIAGLRIFLPNDMRSQEQRNTARKNIEEVKRRFGDGISALDPVENMKITDDSFKALIRVSAIIWLAVHFISNHPRRKLRFWSLAYLLTHCTTLLD
jgi:ATP-dependent RNA helicase DOB1